MEYSQLGDLTVSRIGLGCMGMSHLFNPSSRDDSESVRTLHRAIELGVTLLDTAEIYGPYSNEELLGEALAGKRDQVVLASKFGITSHVGGPGPLDSSAANIRAAVEGSLKRLRTDRIDLYYQHRVDKTVPIEDVVGTLVELKEEGKILHLGLSEAGQETIRRAHAVHPITALQSEYSLWTRDGDDGTLATLAELGIGFVPYSPLSRGMLSGKIRSLGQFEEGDWRLGNPRFQPGAFERNLAAVGELEAIAEEVAATPAQVALAWLLHLAPDWSPIPGTTRVAHLEEDLGAVDVVLDADQMARLTRITQPVGGHHSEQQMALMDR